MKTIKCLVWDLDDTLWDGVLLEGGGQRLRDGVAAVVQGLDARGILQSIASKNDEAAAMARLRDLGLAEYFLYPQIGWGAKSQAISRIAGAIGIAVDALAFIDDQAFEREEVGFSHPSVLCLDAAGAGGVLERAEFQPRFVTDESRHRRQLYLADQARTHAEQSFDGPSEAFLATLGLVCSIRAAREDDLRRAEELTVRTHQLNSTGVTYSYDELDQLRQSPSHDVLVAGLSDRFGTYGTIGLALVERQASVWTIKLLLVSCRVISRGVGGLVLNHLIAQARIHGVALDAEFVANDVNRMMFVAYRLAGFQEHGRRGDVAVLRHDGRAGQPQPAWVTVTSDAPQASASPA